MKTFFRRGIALVLMCVAAVGVMTVNAQEMPQLPPLPVDDAVRVGHLDNGLTYYIRHNETPKGQADFYIAQKVGSSLEEENQRGLAHFLEHMCFNGTANFPGNNLIDWLESVGVKFGYNLNAYTSIDETVYNISSVPVARKSVQDSCLLILHDWACNLTLDPEEIDKERGVIHEEWRRTNVGQMRILEKLTPKIYPNNRYGVRWPIGTMEVVDNFAPKALRDYYETWYRPDQQGIIVVGDIDVDYIEGKIKELFSPIKMPANPKEREYVQVEDTPGTLYGIGTDKEMSAPVFMLMFKTDVFIPREMRNTQAFYPTDYLLKMVSMMLNNRLDELAQKPTTNYAQAGAELGDFFLAKTKGALTLQGYAKGGDIIPGFKEAYRELLRAARGGFTVGEYERAKAEFLSHVEKQYNNRNNTQTERYSRELVRSFIDNDPIPGIEFEYQFYQQLTQMLNVDVINTVLPQLIQDDNRAFLAMLPENDAVTVPTEEQVAAAIAEVEAEDIEPYRDEMKSEPLIPALPKAGSVKATSQLKEWDATEYTLSNGVKVIVKPTNFKENEIKLYAVAKGGISTVDESKAATIKFLDYGMSQHGLGTYTALDLQKYLQGKQANVGLDLSRYYRSVVGSTTVKDLPTLMELLYMTFVDYNITEDEFAATQSSISGVLANQESTPEYLFSKGALSNLFKADSRQALSVADIKAADRQATLDIVHSMVANAADFTFVFVGNIDMDTFKPLMEQYIATLPADAKKATKGITNRADIEPILAASNVRETTAMETPQSWVFIGSIANVPYTAENKAIISIASQILSNRLLKKVREEMGATYSIGASGSIDRLSNANTFIQIAFPMKPEMKDEVLPLIKGMVDDMAKTVTDDELNPIKEFMVKSAKESFEENGDWASAIASTTLNGVQTFTNQIDVVNSITVEKVQNLMATILKQGNYRVYVLDPAE
jgi:zinc protease